jgi:serine/threonine-protein kinase
VRVGRYQIFREIARGGMATVHLGRWVSDHGLGRLVAVKRLHRHYAADPDFIGMFLDEARLAARVRHPNVVALLDLVSTDEEVYMILEYVEGETLGKLIAATRSQPIPDGVVSGIMSGALRGLHAAHEASAPSGEPLGIVHRDFTPQNVIVGVDGAARVVDFGVAKAAVRAQTTRDGSLKGKLGYMAPEQVKPGAVVDRRTDIFAAGVMLWELLVRTRLFQAESEGQVIMRIMTGAYDPPSDHAPALDRRWDDIVMRAMALSPERRFQTAREMAAAIEATFPVSAAEDIGSWVGDVAAATLHKRAAWVAEIDRLPLDGELDTASPAAPLLPTNAEGQTAVMPTVLALRPARRGWSRLLAISLALLTMAGVAVAFSRDWSRQNVAPAEPEPAPTTPMAVSAAEPPAVAPAPVAEEPTTASPTVASPASPPKAASRGRDAKSSPSARAAPTSTAKSCRYFDERERIWKFRVECYE